MNELTRNSLTLIGVSSRVMRTICCSSSISFTSVTETFGVYFSFFTDLPYMLKIYRNGSNFNVYATTMMTSGVIYTLSQFNDANRSGILADSGVPLMDANSEYDLMFACLDMTVTFNIGMLAL